MMAVCTTHHTDMRPWAKDDALLTLLPIGRDNAIAARELGALMASRLGAALEAREVRQMVSDLRRKGVLIGSAISVPCCAAHGVAGDGGDTSAAGDGGGSMMNGQTTSADRTLFMAHVMSAMRARMEYHRPMPDDQSEGARAWASVYQVVCWAEQFLLGVAGDAQEQRRAS